MLLIIFVVFQLETGKKMSKKLSLNGVVAYECHVKGVSFDDSASVKNKGTFKGLTERLEHIRSMGVNQLILMPVYEYEDKVNEVFGVPDGVKLNTEGMIHNYWGFTKGDYFNVKKSYGEDKDFKELVKMAHSLDMEIVCMFHFDADVNTEQLLNVLKHWKKEYKVDGFFLNVNPYYLKMVSDCSALKDMKLYNYDIDNGLNYTNHERIAVYDYGFRNVLRRMLKGDEGAFVDYYNYLNHDSDIKRIISITSHNGFTLNDLYSYNRKHNEPNGENNRDGEDMNYSDNFGIEGETKEQFIISARLKAMKNALLMLLLSKGVPMLLAGDEAKNSQMGNNNAYCQDNEIGWVQYDKEYENILSQIIKTATNLRSDSDIYSGENPCTSDNVNKHLIPGLSLHTGEAWDCNLDYFTKSGGFFYTTDTSFLYIAANFDKYEKILSIPHLPKAYKWSMIAGTDVENKVLTDADENLVSIRLKSQSVTVFIGRK